MYCGVCVCVYAQVRFLTLLTSWLHFLQWGLLHSLLEEEYEYTCLVLTEPYYNYSNKIRIAFNKNFAELFFTDQQLGNLVHSQVKWLATAIPTSLHSTALP